MTALLAIVVYGCEIDGVSTDSVDIQVRYFDTSDISAVENRILAEPPHTYANHEGETVSWPFLRIAALEPLDSLVDGAEIIGFIGGIDGFREARSEP